MAPDPVFPYWPAALNKKMASAYCGLSTETFEKVCPVKPIRMTDSARGERYLRQRIDEWLLSIDANSSPAKPRLSLAEMVYGLEFKGSPTKRRRKMKDG